MYPTLASFKDAESQRYQVLYLSAGTVAKVGDPVFVVDGLSFIIVYYTTLAQVAAAPARCVPK